eukprot:251401_1
MEEAPEYTEEYHGHYHEEEDMTQLAVYQQAVYGNEQPMMQLNAHQRFKSIVLDPREETLKDQIESDFRGDPNARDIFEYNSDFISIRFIEAFPFSSDSIDRISENMQQEFAIKGTESNPLQNEKQEPYLLFNVGDIKIESVQIDANDCKKLKIYSSQENHTDLSQWELLAIKRDEDHSISIGARFYLEYKHKPFIKICFGDYIPNDHREENITISTLKWKGIEPVIKDEITDQIRVYQVSVSKIQNGFYGRDNPNEIYHEEDAKLLISSLDDSVGIENNNYVILDCNDYEVNKLRIIAHGANISFTVRKSELANAYSFRTIEPIQIQCTTTEYSTVININDDGKGFTRYMQIEFGVEDKAWVNGIRVFGKKCTNIPIESEQFDAILDGEQKEDIDAPYAPKVIARTTISDFTISKLTFRTPDFKYDHPLKLHCVVPGFIIIDLGNNDVLYIRTVAKEPMIKTVVISTVDRYKDIGMSGADPNEWILMLKHNAFDHDLFHEYNLKHEHKKYIKLEFMDGLKDMNEFAFPLVQIECFGDSPFLKEPVTLTMDDYKIQNPINIGATQAFAKHYFEKYYTKLSAMTRISADGMRAEVRYSVPGHGDEWMKGCADHWTFWMSQHHVTEEFSAYMEPTLFQQEELLNIVQKKKQFCHDFVMRLAEAQAEDNENNPDKSLAQTYGQGHLQDVFQEMEQNVSKLHSMNIEQKYKNKANEDIYKCFEEAVREHPMVISDKYNAMEYETMIRWANDHKSDEKEALYGVLRDLFNKSFKEEQMFLHKYFVFMLSNDAWSDEKYPVIICDKVCQTLNKFRNNGSISNHEKHFIKFLLCWDLKEYYHEILLTAKRIMNILSKPLLEEYKTLRRDKAKILRLLLDIKDRLPSDIVSNHGLLKWNYSKWYQYRKAYFYPQDVTDLVAEWKNIGLPVKDEALKDLRHNYTDHNNTDNVFMIADELAMEYVNLIAVVLDPSFQQSMNGLFEENRKALSLEYPSNNNDLGVLSGPVKTKARQNVKIKLDYCNHPTPQVMNILDIVRCAVVCETENELCCLYGRIVARFSGKILRVKNAFDEARKGTYGYRAVLINIAYGDETVLAKGFEMICEVQLLLLKYYEVRKNMHLGYGIVRSEDNGLNKSQQPSTVLAQDSCKLGKLDI